MNGHEKYMHRCLELAKLGQGQVAPNPMVGAVLVYNNQIIGEGYHRQYGFAHAEVNCLNSVKDADKHLIKHATLYVSLEPCAHFGKTPPCADFIIKNNIPVVVVACRDSYTEVDGKGIQKLTNAGIKVITPVLENAAVELNRRFFTFHNHQRPFIVLKWAQSANNKIGGNGNERLLISDEITNRQVHKWRGEEAAILVGTNTALKDNPSLTTRLWPGNNPTRLVIDKDLKLPPTLHLFDGKVKTIVFNSLRHEAMGELIYHQIVAGTNFIKELLNALYKYNIQSVLVEGGARLLQSFIDANCWDEMRVITNTELTITDGVASPLFSKSEKTSTVAINTDVIDFYKNNGSFII